MNTVLLFKTDHRRLLYLSLLVYKLWASSSNIRSKLGLPILVSHKMYSQSTLPLYRHEMERERVRELPVATAYTVVAGCSCKETQTLRNKCQLSVSEQTTK